MLMLQQILSLGTPLVLKFVLYRDVTGSYLAKRGLVQLDSYRARHVGWDPQPNPNPNP